jgi:hypothetical protein
MYKLALVLVAIGGYAVFVTFQPLFVALFNGLHAAGF